MPRPDYHSGGFAGFLDALVTWGLERFGLYYSDYRAIVVDNEDSDNLGRLIVRVPAIGDNESTRRLAYPSAPAAGSGYGFRSVPPVGSMVKVTFENGKADIPVWVGSWWSANQMPEEWRDNVYAHGWITPLGHKLLMNEKSGEEYIKIQHIAGSEIVMDKDGNISVFNKDGSKVNVGLGADEAGVRGDTLKSLLESLIDEINALTVPTGVGPSSTPINSANFLKIKADLAKFLSKTVVVK